MSRKLFYSLCALFVAAGYSYCEQSTEGGKNPILDCAFSVARSIPTAPDRIRALCQVARGYARAAQKEKANECCSEARKAGKGSLLTGGMGGEPAPLLVDAGLYEYGLEAAKQVGDAAIRIGLIGLLGEKLAEEGRTEEAAGIAEMLSAQAPNDLYVLKQCGRLYAMAGQVDRADMMFRRALELLETKEMATGPQSRLREALTEYARCCPYENVLTTLKDLYAKPRLAGLLQDVGETFLKEHNTEAAERAFRDAQAAGREIQENEQKALVQASLAMRNVLLGRAEDARQLLGDVAPALRGVTDPNLRDDAWKAVAVARAGLGEFEEARAAMEKIRDPYDLSDAMVKVGYELAGAGQFQKALSEIEGVPKDFVKQKGLTELARVCAEAGRYEEALRAVEGIERRAYRMGALVGVARGMGKRGEYKRALDVLRMVPNPGAVKDKAASELVAQCTGPAGKGALSENLSVAMSAAAIMRSPEDKWRSMVRVAEAYEAAARAEDALKVLEEARGVTEGIQPDLNRSRALALTFSKEARIYGMMGRTEKARELVGETVKIAESLENSIVRDMLVEGSMKELIEKGEQFGLAFQLVSGLSDVSSRAKGFFHLAAAHAARGRPDAASDAMQGGLRWTEKESDPSKKVGLLLKAAEVWREGHIKISEGGSEVLRRIAQ